MIDKLFTIRCPPPRSSLERRLVSRVIGSSSDITPRSRLRINPVVRIREIPKGGYNRPLDLRDVDRTQSRRRRKITFDSAGSEEGSYFSRGCYEIRRGEGEFEDLE